MPFRYHYQRPRVETAEEFGIQRPLSFLGYLLKAVKMKPGSSEQIMRYFAERNRNGANALDLSRHYTLEGGPRIRMGAVGDLMLVERTHEMPFTRRVAERLRGYDFLHGNLETMATPHQKPGRFRSFLELGFNVKPDYLDHLATGVEAATGAGFDLLGLSNNHSLDTGREGLAETLAEVEARGIQTVGVARVPGEEVRIDSTQRHGRFSVVERNGLKLSVIPMTWGINQSKETPPYLNALPVERLANGKPDTKDAARLIAEARAAGADVIVMSLHQGHEYEWYPDPFQMEMARELAALGADVIVGHHPHVLQPMEVLHVNVPEAKGSDHYVEDKNDPRPRTCVVAYSLGNYLSYMPTDSVKLGGELVLDFEWARQRATGARHPIVTGAGIVPTYAQRRGLFPLGLFDARTRVRDVNALLRGEDDGIDDPKMALDRDEMARILRDAGASRLGPWLLRSDEPIRP